MLAGLSVGGIVSVASFLIGLAGLIVAVRANAHSKRANRHAEEATAAAKEANRIAERSNTIAAEALTIAKDQGKVKIRIELDLTSQPIIGSNGTPFESKVLVLRVVNEGVDCDIVDAGLCQPSGKRFIRPIKYTLPYRLPSKSSYSVYMGLTFVGGEVERPALMLPKFSVAGAVTASGEKAELADNPVVIEWIQDMLSRVA